MTAEEIFNKDSLNFAMIPYYEVVWRDSDSRYHSDVCFANPIRDAYAGFSTVYWAPKNLNELSFYLDWCARSFSENVEQNITFKVIEKGAYKIYNAFVHKYNKYNIEKWDPAIYIDINTKVLNAEEAFLVLMLARYVQENPVFVALFTRLCKMYPEVSPDTIFAVLHMDRSWNDKNIKPMLWAGHRLHGLFYRMKDPISFCKTWNLQEAFVNLQTLHTLPWAKAGKANDVGMSIFPCAEQAKDQRRPMSNKDLNKAAVNVWSNMEHMDPQYSRRQMVSYLNDPLQQLSLCEVIELCK